MLDIGGDQRRTQNIPDEFQTADLRRHILGLQAVLQSHQIHRTPCIVQLAHGLEQDPVLLIVEILAADKLGGHHNGLPIHDHGTDHRLLRLHAVGQNPFQNVFFHGRLGLYNLHHELSRHLRVQLHGHLIDAEALDAFRQLNLFLVQLYAVLLLVGRRDLLCGH